MNLKKKYTGKKLVDGYLRELPPAIQRIVKTLRSMARRNLPGAIELVYHNALGYGVSDSPFDRVCYIAPQRNGYVNLGFFYGVDLPDPAGLIEGKGKRIRHVKIYTLAAAKDPQLAQLTDHAWRNAASDVSGWRNSLKNKTRNGLSDTRKIGNRKAGIEDVS